MESVICPHCNYHGIRFFKEMLGGKISEQCVCCDAIFVSEGTMNYRLDKIDRLISHYRRLARFYGHELDQAELKMHRELASSQSDEALDDATEFYKKKADEFEAREKQAFKENHFTERYHHAEIKK